MAETTVEKQALASAVLSDYKCFTSITLFYYCVTMMLLHNVSQARKYTPPKNGGGKKIVVHFSRVLKLTVFANMPFVMSHR